MDPVLDHAPCGFLSFTDDGIIRDVNETLVRLLAYDSRDSIVNKSVEELLPVASKIFYNTHLFPLLRMHGEANEIFMMFQTSDKRHVPFLLNAVRRDKNPSLTECIIMRISERKKYEDEILAAKRNAEQALEKNEQLSQLTIELESKTQTLDHKVGALLSVNRNLLEFNKIITHDFQESIRKIELFAGKIRAEGRADVSRILSAAARLRSMTAALEIFVDLQDDRQPGLVDLNGVLKNATKEVRAKRPDVIFDIESDPLPAITGHLDQLRLMFYHLIDNACMFRHESRSLVITVQATLIKDNYFRTTTDKYKYVDFVKIDVSDNGTGFDPKYNDYVFGMLKKIDVSSPGLGVGLGLVKKIVENHRGSVRANGTPETGVTISITLPIKFN